MKKWILENILNPTIKAMADLCEKHQITFICYIEFKDGMTTDVRTVHMNKDCSQIARNVLKASEGKK